MIRPTLHEVLHSNRADVISIGFVTALWAGSSATATFVNTTTIAYGMRDQRGALRSRLLALGLFLGSGTAIAHNGPGLLASYAAAGVVVYFIMRALGELMLYRPVAGSFASYAAAFIGPWAGYVTGEQIAVAGGYGL